MRAATTTLLLSLSVVLPGAGSTTTAADEPPARFAVATRKADDAVAVGGNQQRTVFDITSPSGIGRAVVERIGDTWPKAVVVRLHLKGLENLKVVAGKVSVGAAVGGRAGAVEVRQWQLDKDETPLAAADPRRLAVRVLGRDGKPAAGIPLTGGHVEVTLPAEYFRDNPKSLTVDWIDFYR